MVVTGVLFVGVTAIVKYLGPRIPAAELAFLRYALGLVFLIPLWPQLRRERPSPRALQAFAIRGTAHTGAVILWFFAMAQITMAEVTAMNYLTPVYNTLGAALFLGERLAVRRLLAVGVALVGALVILRPGVRPLEAGHYAMLGTAVLFAVSYLMAKRMTDDLSPALVVTMLSVTVTIGLAPFALLVWQPVGWREVGWLFLTAALATGGHFAMTNAFRAGPMAVTQPVTFLQLVWAVSLGALLFHEPVDGWVVLGGLMILGAVSFIAWREYRLKQVGR
jgi:drug/metabolite transporter (DMT)-like permease